MSFSKTSLASMGSNLNTKCTKSGNSNSLSSSERNGSRPKITGNDDNHCHQDWNIDQGLEKTSSVRVAVGKQVNNSGCVVGNITDNGDTKACSSSGSNSSTRYFGASSGSLNGNSPGGIFSALTTDEQYSNCGKSRAYPRDLHSDENGLFYTLQLDVDFGADLYNIVDIMSRYVDQSSCFSSSGLFRNISCESRTTRRKQLVGNTLWKTRRKNTK